MIRRPLLTFLAIVCLGQIPAGRAAAHNSLDSSVPESGAIVAVAPTEIVMRFAKDVPLETLTVTLTDPSGVRSELVGSRHGSTETEVVTPLPQLGTGDNTVRWRLVSPDGHAISGRIGFTLSPSTAPTTTMVGETTSTIAGSLPSTTLPPIASLPLGPDATAVGGDEVSLPTPEPIRWAARYAAYLGIMIVAGLAASEVLLRRQPLVAGARRLFGIGLATVAVATVVQLLVLASDVSGSGLLSSFGSLDTAVELDVGMALVVRLVLVAAAWLLSGVRRPVHRDTQTDVTILLALGLLATWSFAGHARSLHWPALGVPLDVVHHGAAATWLGGLGVVGFLVLQSRPSDEAIVMLRRFSHVAEWSVVLIVATGVIQYVRLMEGDVGRGVEALATTGHGRLVLAKAALLGAMMWFAARHRRVVRAGLENSADPSGALAALRASIRREAGIGLVVIGLTASLVTTMPSEVDEASPAPAAATSNP